MIRAFKILGYGFLMWLVPFIISLLIYPLKISFTPLFESIMPVVISFTSVLLLIFYFKGKNPDLRECTILGISWFLISIFIDLLLFLPSSPMHMGLINYMMDIGITYLIIPIISMGMGYMFDNRT